MWIVFREIVVRDIRIQTRFNVTKILCREGMRIVLRMAGNERDAFVFTGKEVGIAVFRFGQNFRVGIIADQLCRKIGVARMGSRESVIETTRQQRMRVKDVVFVYARKFVAAGLLGNTIQDIQCGLYRPTDKQGGRDVIFLPTPAPA